MKHKSLFAIAFLFFFSSLLFVGCKKCYNCNYTTSTGSKGPTEEVCGDDYENLKSQRDADKYTCVAAE